METVIPKYTALGRSSRQTEIWYILGETSSLEEVQRVCLEALNENWTSFTLEANRWGKYIHPDSVDFSIFRCAMYTKSSKIAPFRHCDFYILDLGN